MERKGTFILWMIFLVVGVMLSGCTGAQQERAGEDLPSDMAADPAETPVLSGLVNRVGVWADIQKISGDQMKIRPDTDGLPEELTVAGIQGLPDAEQYREGMKVQVLMEEQGGTYLAREVIPLAGDEELADQDILLTEAPVLELTDLALSVVGHPYEVMPGSHTWNVEKNGQMESMVACGSEPLEAVGRGERLEVSGETGIFSFSTKIAPDILRVRQWDAADIGRTDVMEECVTAYYYKMPLLEMEAGKVYALEAEWKEEGFTEKKFYGTVTYVFETE